jgi:hypothetical protein
MIGSPRKIRAGGGISSSVDGRRARGLRFAPMPFVNGDARRGAKEFYGRVRRRREKGKRNRRRDMRRRTEGANIVLMAVVLIRLDRLAIRIECQMNRAIGRADDNRQTGLTRRIGHPASGQKRAQQYRGKGEIGCDGADVFIHHG